MPNPHRNETLRRRYRRVNDHCELWEHLEESGDFDWQQLRNGNPGFGNRPLELHHIYSDGMRYDLWSNFIVCSKLAHDWFHRNPREGRVLCFYVKWEKGELDRQELREACGRDVVAQIFENLDGLEQWAADLQMSVRESRWYEESACY